MDRYKEKTNMDEDSFFHKDKKIIESNHVNNFTAMRKLK